jgi:hypothetical protein
LITKINLLGNARLAFYRNAAFEALTHNRGSASEQLLMKLTSSWRPDIRQQAAAAIEQRRRAMYGGSA